MSIEEILQRVDRLFEENKTEEAVQLMHDSAGRAMQDGDDEALLQLLNEMLGYYRETGQADTVSSLAQRAVDLAERMGLEDTIPYATTLLNAATAYRAVGMLEDSLERYLQVRALYSKLLEPKDMLAASLENNISLLYQELGMYEEAKQCQLKALQIAEEQSAAFELGVTYANLASTRLRLGETEEAKIDAERAVAAFRAANVEDSHYAAAVSAIATYYYEKKEYPTALQYFRQASDIIERNLGHNKSFYRLQENIAACEMAIGEKTDGKRKEEGRTVMGENTVGSGLALCRAYYEEVCRPMLVNRFGQYLDRIAAGLVGEGSDCFGYDDENSRDHDWGPDVCLWVTEETYEQIGEQLERAYEELPTEWRGYKRSLSPQGKGRRGVSTVKGFYERLLQTADYDHIDWRSVSDASLAAAVNGEVFTDPEGVFTEMRTRLQAGYPEGILYLKIAEAAASFSQCGQYNYARMRKRGDAFTAGIMLSDCIKAAMKLQHYIEGRYPLHDKWLYRSLRESEAGCVLANMLGELQRISELTDRSGQTAGLFPAGVEAQIEQIGAFLASELYQCSLISDTDSYLDAHVDELLKKSLYAANTDEELVEKIARLEFEAFDKVQNEGGRAECQNNWPTFSIMRKSQYLTWNRTMLLQYLYDFDREYRKGHNLITEKYARMMESTTPDEYARISDNFPALSQEKKNVIEQIVGVQVNWMEEFAGEYPYMASNARSIRTAQDKIWDTSYETYLRGEISTYSDKMLQLYGNYIVEYAREGKNLAYAIMENSAHLYGYKSLEDAEAFLAQ